MGDIMTEDKVKRTPGYAKGTMPGPEETMTFEEAMLMFNQGTMKALEYIIGMCQAILNRTEPPKEDKEDEQKVWMP